VQDYRLMVLRTTFPKMTPVSAAEDLLEESGHCPFYEEAERFNTQVADFLAR